MAEPRATQRIDDWIKEQIEGASSLNLPEIAARGRAAFLSDPVYLQELFADQLEDLVYRRAQRIFARSRVAPVVLGDEIVDREEFARRADRLKWEVWLEHAGETHVLLRSMTRLQLLAAAEEREARAASEARRAAFLRRLAAGLTGVQTVGEAFRVDQIERIWVEVHRDRKVA